MTISPVELHHIGLKRGLLGYRRQPVDRLIEEIADSFEEVWRQRADFADRIEHLESDLARHRDLETLLRSTLVSAERSAHEQKDQARREAGLIVEEAHAEARAVTRAAAAERERLLAETRKVRALLEAALDAVEDGLDEHRPEAGAVAGAEERAESEAA
jgi:cell division initiation protein